MRVNKPETHIQKEDPKEELQMSEKEKDDEYINDDFDGDDFDFVEAYDDDPAGDDRLLPDNEARCAIRCAFLGVFYPLTRSASLVVCAFLTRSFLLVVSRWMTRL